MEKWITFQNQPWWIWCFLGPISLSPVFGLYCHSIWNTHFPVIHVFSCHLLSSGIFLRALLVSSFMFLAYGSFIWLLELQRSLKNHVWGIPMDFFFLVKGKSNISQFIGENYFSRPGSLCFPWAGRFLFLP